MFNPGIYQPFSKLSIILGPKMALQPLVFGHGVFWPRHAPLFLLMRTVEQDVEFKAFGMLRQTAGRFCVFFSRNIPGGTTYVGYLKRLVKQRGK